jgi:membrane-bound serine protease (ClpP class)
VCRHLSVRRLFFALLIALPALAGAIAQQRGGEAPQHPAVLAGITGAIGPAAAHYVQNVVDEARGRQAEVLILQLDTPGGLLSSTREIVQAILASPVPVIGYVAPGGAHAASAGTYILYATSIAAMAPGTNIGAATPVQIGGTPSLPSPTGPQPAPVPGKEKNKNKGAEPAKPAQAPLPTVETKAANDAVAWIRSLAELRGRNADWAEKAVREAATLNPRQALAQHVIELIAPDVTELLRAVDGRKVVINGEARTLHTVGIAVVRIEPGFMTKVLGTLANPNVALILMLIGTYGLIFELMSPGAVAPGVIGAICLVLGLYSLSELPLDYAGLALVMLGMSFMLAEAFVPSFGILGFGGIAAFVIGAAMLVNTDTPEFRVSYSVIITMATVSAVFLILLMGYVWRSQHRKAVSGAEELTGSEAIVLSWENGEGYVWAQGERWHARGEKNYAAGQRLKVEKLDGLTLVLGSK